VEVHDQRVRRDVALRGRSGSSRRLARAIMFVVELSARANGSTAPMHRVECGAVPRNCSKRVI
jgi:hypothetical protein